MQSSGSPRGVSLWQLLYDRISGNRVLSSSRMAYLSQQLAFMRHPTGKLIEPHVHNPVPRQVQFTQETLFIRKGKLRVDFYDPERQYLESRILRAGDVILLIQGGHGFEVLEEIEMIEVKQGPYVGEEDKTRFIGIDKDQVRLAE